MTDNNININTLKDIALQKIAYKHDIQNSNGILEGEELLAFNKDLKQQNIVTNITNLSDLKVPQKILSDKNVITVVENYSKNNKNTTLFGALIKESDIGERKVRKQILLETFNIFYDAIFATTKTQAQKEELELLKNKFLNSVNEELDESWFEVTISNSKINNIVNTMLKYHTASSEELAGGIFDYIDNTSFSFGDAELSYLLDSIDPGNVISVSQKIKEHKANTDKESLLRILAQEYTFPFDNDESNDKKKRINTFVTQFFQATNYSESPYMAEAKKMINAIIESTDTGSNVFTSDIANLESLMDSILLNKPKDIAEKLYSLINDNSYALDRADVRVLLDKINSSNIQKINEEFEKLGDKKSLIKMIDEEWEGTQKLKPYTDKLILTQFDASNINDKQNAKKYLLESLKNENVEDTEKLLKLITIKNRTPSILAQNLYDELKNDEDNVNKEISKYILNSITTSNVSKFLSDFNLRSKVSLVEYLQENGEETSLSQIKNLTNMLFEVNNELFSSDVFTTTLKLKKEDLQSFVEKNIEDEDDIKNIVNVMLPAKSKDIAKAIADIADDKSRAADDITFKLWIGKITPDNVLQVINEFKKQNSGKTPINAIVEEARSKKTTRQALVLHILSAIIQKIGKENIGQNLIDEFTAMLESELYGWSSASAKNLNKLIDKMLEDVNAEELEEEVFFDPDNLKLTNIRANVSNLEFGQKYGKYSWEYENLKNISTLEDVAKFTGLREEFLEELIDSEGCRNEAYKCSSDKWTIGIGHNFENAKADEAKYLRNENLSTAEIYRLFAYDLTAAIHNLVKIKGIETIHLTPGEYEALVDVAFNTPANMDLLTVGTKKGIELRKEKRLKEAAEVFEKTSKEFNQQFSAGEIVAGLCKRRIKNVLRYMDVKDFYDLENCPSARTRIIILLKNGEEASPIYKTSHYKAEICEILGIDDVKYQELLDAKI